jgi:hypothetical protein
MQRADAEGGGLLQDFARGLRARQADEEHDRIERRRRFSPGEGEGEGRREDFIDPAFAPWTIDEAGIERVAFAAA